MTGLAESITAPRSSKKIVGIVKEIRSSVNKD